MTSYDNPFHLNAKQVEVAKQCFQFWTQGEPKLERIHAMGPIASAYAESSFIPTAVGDRGKAFGLHQLHSDRCILIRDGQHLHGHPIWPGCGIDVAKLPSVQDQLKAVWWELQHSEHKALQNLKLTHDAKAAGLAFCMFYERPGAKGQGEHRAMLAAQLLEWYDSIFPAVADV